MKKLLTTTALAVSLCAGAAFPASAETVVGNRLIPHKDNQK